MNGVKTSRKTLKVSAGVKIRYAALAKKYGIPYFLMFSQAKENHPETIFFIG